MQTLGLVMILQNTLQGFVQDIKLGGRGNVNKIVDLHVEGICKHAPTREGVAVCSPKEFKKMNALKYHINKNSE